MSKMLSKYIPIVSKGRMPAYVLYLCLSCSSDHVLRDFIQVLEGPYLGILQCDLARKFLVDGEEQKTQNRDRTLTGTLTFPRRAWQWLRQGSSVNNTVKTWFSINLNKSLRYCTVVRPCVVFFLSLFLKVFNFLKKTFFLKLLRDFTLLFMHDDIPHLWAFSFKYVTFMFFVIYIYFP